MKNAVAGKVGNTFWSRGSSEWKGLEILKRRLIAGAGGCWRARAGWAIADLGGSLKQEEHLGLEA